MKTLISAIILFFLNSNNTKVEISLDKDEAQKAFRLLSDIRVYPSKYFGEFHFLSKSYSNKRENNFESIQMGDGSGEEAIKSLIIDKDVPSLGHRIHLLGLDEWNSNLTDVGIGYAVRESGEEYTQYVCVLIAKHDW